VRDSISGIAVRSLERPNPLRIVHAAVDGGTPAAVEQQPVAIDEPDDTALPRRVALLGAGGMLGPSATSALVTSDGFDLVRVTDIGGSPALR